MADKSDKSALLIAFHFPPVSGSSGLQRTLSLTRQLPKLQWQPLVLSAHPRAYERVNDGQLRDIPESTVVKRAFALDTRRHLSLRGRYLYFMALPDQWVSWCLGGVFSGFGLVRKHRPTLIWSTYPIATAHLIGLILHRLTGLPWVADFRDSMTEDHYPPEKTKRAVYRWIEKKAIHACSKALFTTPGTVDMYRQRYPDIPQDRMSLLPNGYDEEVFAQVEIQLSNQGGVDVSGRKKKVLLHSGVVYPGERDPSQFFEALSHLDRANLIDSERLVVKFRACEHEDYLRELLHKYDVEHLVELLPVIPYREALAEILAADALLILQASNCNHQVPAKVYEYFRAQRPVLGLTDPAGDTARVMREAGLNQIVPLNDADAIAAALPGFLRGLEEGGLPTASFEAVERSSRQHSTELVAEIFEQIIASN